MWVENNRLYDRYVGLDGKTHKASVPLTRDTPQAHRTAEKALKNKIADILSYKENRSLNDLICDYLSHKDIKPSSMVNYQNAFGKIVEILDDVPIGMLTSPYIKRKFMESGKPTSATNRYIALLGAFGKWLLEYGYINKPLNLSVDKVKKKPVEASDLFLEADELRDLLDTLKGSMDGYICHFMALTGCRLGEAVALTIDDIDDKYIHITKSFDEHNRIIGTPKTMTSARDIFIQPELRTMLREFYEWRMLYMMAEGIRTDRLFFSNRGTFYCGGTLRRKLHSMSDKYHPHIFRHTHVALLAEQGLPLDTIARRLGHSDSRVTKKIYFHVTNRMKENDEQLLERTSFL